MENEFSPYDTVEYLTTEEEVAAYMAAAMEDGDPQLIVAALGDIARARNVTQLARDTGLTRQGIMKAFSAGSKPSFDTIMRISTALGFRLTVVPVASGAGSSHST
jgi:probable addiction module antidote protein